MRFTIGAAAFLAASVARADEEAPSSAAEVETSTSVTVPKSTFTPTTLKAPFLEQFTDDWESRWKASSAKKDDKSTEEEWAYVGKWSVEEPSVLKGIEGDKGLVIKDKAAHHAISAKFPKAVNNKGKTLVVQYEVKLQNGLECGGAYIKLLQQNAALDQEEFSNASPYIIMFGPDKCGSTNKVHFIFRHKNPITGEYEEKHLKDTATMNNVKTTSLYTLIVNPDQTFDIHVDGVSVRTGSLLENFLPAVNPAKEIDDPNDKKPSDWVDLAKMADPEAVKPDDWDEDAPFEIVDESAEKPDDWLEDEPPMIPDPEAEKPEDWDDEEDGDFVAPLVPNPKCEEASGCGPWEKPTIKNPAYKGRWSAPMIDNPDYKGVWAPQKIANPDYFESTSPADFEPMGALGIELWSMQNDILFDNIYIGHSVADAKKLKEETFDVKIAIEKEEDEATKPKADDPIKQKSPLDLKFMDDPVTYVKEKFELFMTIAQRDPLEAVRFVPEIPAAAAVLLVTLLMLVFGGLFGGAAAAPAVNDAIIKEKAKTAEAKDQAADAVATGAENVKEDVNKRSTRSSGPAQ